jgi:hypothetical protein
MRQGKGRFIKALLTVTAAALIFGAALFGCLGENGGILLGFGGNGSGSSKGVAGGGGGSGGGGGGGGGGDNPPINGAGTSPVGDWRLNSSDDTVEILYVSDDPEEKMLFSFMQSGNFAKTEFYKVKGVWIEYPAVDRGRGTWRSVNDSTVNIRVPNSNGGYSGSNWRYKVLRDTLVLIRCDSDGAAGGTSGNNGSAARRCYESMFVKVDTAAFRSGLRGDRDTILPYNPDLRGQWVLQGGNSESDEIIYFGIYTFSNDGAKRYVGDEDYSGKYYYTTSADMRLHFVVENNCSLDQQGKKQCTTERDRSFTYDVAGTGDNRILTIRTEQWVVYHGEAGLTKSKRGKQPNRL